MIERLNKAILNSANNLPAALLLLVVVYIMAEAHNYAALREFAEVAGVPVFLSYVTPLMLGLFILIVYWILVAYKSQGYSTAGPWLAVVAFVVGSAALNVEHYGYAPKQISIALLSPALILFGGTLAKDIVSKQAARVAAVDTLKSLRQAAQEARQALHDLKRDIESLDAQKQAKTGQIKALDAEIAQLKEHRAGVRAGIVDAGDVPERVRQAIQIDALMAAGLNQTDAAALVGIHRNTVQARLQLVNGSGLGGGAI